MATNSFIQNQLGGRRITNVVDEILSRNPNAAGLAANLYAFGSNGQEKADYTRGVLERFNRCASSANKHVKIITNPRMINFSTNPHYADYFEGAYSVNENGGVVTGSFNEPATAEKIVINHYHTKSREEYVAKVQRGNADHVDNRYNMKDFEPRDRNEKFDDGILKYREERAKVYQPPDNSHTDERVFDALAKNLSPTLMPNTPSEFYAGKMETFLTCRAVAAYLQTKLTDAAPAKFFEEAAIKAILKSIGQMSFADARLLLSELPNLLRLSYPVVEELRGACIQFIPLMMNVMRLNNSWLNYVELDYIQRLLKIQK